MLRNGLGQVLLAQTAKSKRLADLFSGSGAVAWYAAEHTGCRVLAADLQLFAASLADAVIRRDKPLDAEAVWEGWSQDALDVVRQDSLVGEAEEFQRNNWEKARRQTVSRAREISAASNSPITRAYGGHYFSPLQALTLDALRSSLPDNPSKRSVALAALICAASECAAAPGHTAQPLRPTEKGAEFLFDAWRRNVRSHAKSALERICPKHAQTPGRAMVGDAESVAALLKAGDVAFVDPPYSGVHYSRFYHVLETVARGKCGEIEGAGRYPPSSERPKSNFSIKSKSKQAFERLLAKLAERSVRTIVTFPEEETSNGLSGPIVEGVAGKYFMISKTVVNGRFSTLGGNSENRKARIPAYEIILTLEPLG